MCLFSVEIELLVGLIFWPHTYKDLPDISRLKIILGSSEERECGCTSLSIIARRKEMAEIIVNKRLIRIVAPLMLDGNASVQNSAVGALRNISLADPDICDHMIQQV